MTVENHRVHPGQKKTYRIPIENVGEFKILSTDHFVSFLGDLVDRLGRYEDLGDIEFLEKMLKK